MDAEEPLREWVETDPSSTDARAKCPACPWTGPWHRTMAATQTDAMNHADEHPSLRAPYTTPV